LDGPRLRVVKELTESELLLGVELEFEVLLEGIGGLSVIE